MDPFESTGKSTIADVLSSVRLAYTAELVTMHPVPFCRPGKQSSATLKQAGHSHHDKAVLCLMEMTTQLHSARALLGPLP